MKLFIIPTIFYLVGIIAMLFNFDGGVVIAITGLFLIDLISNYTIYTSERRVMDKIREMESDQDKQRRYDSLI